jgi:hypothetical protein
MEQSENEVKEGKQKAPCEGVEKKEIERERWGKLGTAT